MFIYSIHDSRSLRLCTMRKGGRRAQSMQCLSHKRIHTPAQIPHSVRRLPLTSLQKLPSASSPVSFERLLQIKFQTPNIPTRVELDGTSDDATTSHGSESDMAECDLDSGSRHTLLSNGSNPATISKSKLPTVFACLPSTFCAPNSSSDSKDVICRC